MEDARTYIAIDLKSFYASVECVDRGLDPLKTNLVVADVSRTEKTICLAVSPSLKAYGISGRARLFEVVQRVDEVNKQRRRSAPGQKLTGSAFLADLLKIDPNLAVDYLVAVPRMAQYIKYSAKIYEVYLKYVSPEDIHVYSIDEVFIDATPYLKLAGLSAHDFARRIIRDVLETTGITATAGIGTNLYLCKVAMDIVAKRVLPDRDGVRIAQLDEKSYRRELWEHTPLTDFWRVGKGYERKLAENGMYTMGDIARCSLKNEDLLYRLFGVNAELLIDHAWGWEPCTMADIKAYQPSANSVGSGQVLQRPYTAKEGRLVVREMTDLLVLDLVEKGLMTNQLTLTVGYDIQNLKKNATYTGEVKIDYYGRAVPKHAHGTINLPEYSSSTREITEAVLAMYDRIVDPKLSVRRMYVTANRVLQEGTVPKDRTVEQLDLFTDYKAEEEKREARKKALEKESQRQKAILAIKRKYGKNAIFKGMNLEEGATTITRNEQIGGHRA